MGEQPGNRLYGETSTDRLYADLVAFIRSAAPHQRISSGRVLGRTYGLSNSAVMQVMDRLVARRLVYKVHGRGTFVAARPPSSGADTAATIVFAYSRSAASHTFYSLMWHGVAETAVRSGLRLQVCALSETRSSGEHDLIDDVSRPDVVGLIVPWIEARAVAEMRRCRPGLSIVVTEDRAAGQEVASVLQDRRALATLAARTAADLGGRRVAVVFRKDAFWQAFTAAWGEPSSPAALPFKCQRNGDFHALAGALAAACPTALVVSEDRLALATLRALEEESPGFLQSTTVISHANAGEEDLLPRSVTRLEVDGYAHGATACTTLKSVADGDLPGHVDIRLKPVLRLAAAAVAAPGAGTVASQSPAAAAVE